MASSGHPCKFQRLSRLGSVTVRHSSSGRQPNFAALNRGRHLYSAERPSRWALAHILVSICAAVWRNNSVSLVAGCDLGDVEVESVLEVLGLRDDHQVETPAAAEVGDDDRVHRHRRQKLFPRRLRRLQSTTRNAQH